MTGHGGDNFLKFQDSEEINAYDIADAFDQMWAMNRYNEILFIIDTCQASTMYERFRSPNIMGISSSMRGESSYSYHVDDEIGVAVIDRFTYALLNFLKDLGPHSNKTVGDFMGSLDLNFLGSTPELRKDLFGRKPDLVKLIDFFGNIQPVIAGTRPFLARALRSKPKSVREDSSSDEEKLDEAVPLVSYDSFDMTGQPKIAANTYILGALGTIGFGLLATALL
jgi:glycosylphosphatidylinositol transamidase (GPIT) subunit GPI8